MNKHSQKSSAELQFTFKDSAEFSRLKSETRPFMTQNQSWGFWGTIHTRGRVDEAVIGGMAWPMALVAVSWAADCSYEEARAFLDSRYGRHFADEVDNLLSDGYALSDAIVAAAVRYTKEWKVTRLTLDTLPRSVRFRASIGAPLLVALVAASQIND